MPPCASSNRPFLLAIGAGEGAALVAEELALQQVLGQRRAVDRDQRAAAGDVAEVDRLGHQLLARAGLAGDQDGARRRADPGDPLEDLAHARALAQQVMVGGLSLEPAAKIGDFVDQPAVFERMVDQNLEADRVERLLNQVVGAELHRLDGVFDGGEAGHDDDRDRQVALRGSP